MMIILSERLYIQLNISWNERVSCYKHIDWLATSQLGQSWLGFHGEQHMYVHLDPLSSSEGNDLPTKSAETMGVLTVGL